MGAIHPPVLLVNDSVSSATVMIESPGLNHAGAASVLTVTGTAVGSSNTAASATTTTTETSFVGTTMEGELWLRQVIQGTYPLFNPK